MKLSALKSIIKESISQAINESSTVYLDKKEYPDFLLKFFKQHVQTIPNRIRMKISEKADLMGQNGEEFFAINVNTGKVSYARAAWVDGSGVNSKSEDALARGLQVDLSDKIIIEKDRFAGKISYTGYIHPKNVNPQNLTSSSSGLSHIEEIVLHIARSLKPAFRLKEFTRLYKNTPQEYESTKQSLSNKGMLNKAGAITVSGRNYLEQKGYGLASSSTLRNEYLKSKNIDPQSIQYGDRIKIED